MNKRRHITKTVSLMGGVPHGPSRTILGLLALVVVLVGSGCRQYSWRESYRYNKQQPYDLYALYELLEAREAGLTYHNDSLGAMLKDSVRNANFVYVGQGLYLDEVDVTALLNFVEHGNTAMICSKWIPDDLIYHFYGPSCFYQHTSGYYESVSYYPDDSVRFHLSEPGYVRDTGFVASFPYNFRPTTHYWAYVDSAMICDPAYGLETMGVLDSGLINFLRLDWGEGHIYLNTSPELFTNYYLSDSSRYDYAKGVFSYLDDGPVFWNEYARSRQPPPQNRQGNPYQPDGGRQLLSDNHGLRFILDQPTLAFAWYLFVFGGLLYLFFRGKRRQRVIPLHRPPENTSMRYVDTVGRLAQQHGNHLRLARREVKMLRHYLYERFHLRWPEGEPPPASLSEHTGIPAQTLTRVLDQIREVEGADWMKEQELLDFYDAIRVFYRV